MKRFDDDYYFVINQNDDNSFIYVICLFSKMIPMIKIKINLLQEI